MASENSLAIKDMYVLYIRSQHSMMLYDAYTAHPMSCTTLDLLEMHNKTAK